jgi:hypothetical protein
MKRRAGVTSARQSKVVARMKAVIVAAVLIVGLSAAGGAQAKGCIKGAVVGGVAGHFVHHGWLGAAAGCAVGHHEAAKHSRESAAQPNR